MLFIDKDRKSVTVQHKTTELVKTVVSFIDKDKES